MTAAKDLLLQAAVMHVPFDGWSQTTFEAAIADSGVERTVAESLCPRGASIWPLRIMRRGMRRCLRNWPKPTWKI